ncbi:assimilatory nitrate reductase catalytic subunit [Vibrio xiamenensis]|uniref:Assimilatory nitrate reductase catalytic subunit n=1 Tax=Vibrio xiamenensis TaxID=861298 RepID=A0A1G7YYK9_9VIBR|nr:nitrate reductase [Vibrio xiamenensis]SDH01553.1 assimilatory nitrate reductase catalytic subunit [Vibrio xiamenensis]
MNATPCQSTCPYCGVGCGVSVTEQAITGDSQHPANSGVLCVKGSALKPSLDMPSRLLYPKLNGQEVSWDVATDTIVEKLKQAVVQHGAHSVAMYVSGQLLTEDYYLANKLMKGYLGTANIDTNSRLCMSSAVAAHIRAFGEDVVPVNYNDLEHTDLIVICGANTAWTHPVLFRRIQAAREVNPELKLVVIDPRKTVTAEQADLHLAIDSDDDVLLFNGLIRYCLDTGAWDDEFIAAHTQGIEALREEVMDPQYSLAALSAKLNISYTDLSRYFSWFAQTPRAVTLFCQGVNQSEYGVDKANAIINAHLVTGKINQRGCGPFSMTGQPNAMGGREVGGLANQLAVHRGFDDESIAKVEQFWQAPNMATEPGLKAVELFDAVSRGDIKVLWIMATNPVVSMPNSIEVRKALKACDFVIVSDIIADSDVAEYADLLLPAAGWGEKQGMVTNSERVISRQRQFRTLPGEAKPDWWAINQVGQKWCAQNHWQNGFGFQTPAEIFREYAALTGINRKSRFQLDLSMFQALSDSDYQRWQPTQWGGERPFTNHLFSTPSGKAQLVVTKPLKRDVSGLWLNTGRLRDQWHTMTRTGFVAHLAASEPEPRVYMSAATAKQHGVEFAQLVKLKQGEHSVYAKAAQDEGLAGEQLYMPMHWAGRYGGQSQVNQVVLSHHDPISGQPAFKSSAVELCTQPVASYGLYLGEQFDLKRCEYLSMQQEQNVKMWRFASIDGLSKQEWQAQAARRLLLDTDRGWIGVECRKVQDQLWVSRICMVSNVPIECDETQLIQCIDAPLNLATLLNAATLGHRSKLVCSCFRVTDTQITRAMQKQGCVTLSDVQQTLKCGTNCGSCVSEIKQLIDEKGVASPLSQTQPSQAQYDQVIAQTVIDK